jgi:hypothetical protein
LDENWLSKLLIHLLKKFQETVPYLKIWTATEETIRQQHFNQVHRKPHLSCNFSLFITPTAPG